MPTKWLRAVEAPPAPPATTYNLDDDVGDLIDLDAKPEKFYPLTQFEWRKDGSSSMAALMILIALSIKLNQSLRGQHFEPGKPRPSDVAITFDELQRMTGFARGPVSTGLKLLEDLGAISRSKIGRANSYKLHGLNEPGGWCQLPQSTLLRSDGTLSIKKLERKRATLHALRVYAALLSLRRQQTNTASISWTGLTRWTGVRRADIGAAIQVLVAWGLVSFSEELDDRHLDGEDRSNRYRIVGLGKVQHASETA
jgi:hypothetical protein